MVERQPKEILGQTSLVDVSIYFPPTVGEGIADDIEEQLSGEGFRVHTVPRKHLVNRVGQRQELYLHAFAGGSVMIQDGYEARAFLDQNTIEVLTEVISFAGGIAGIVGLGLQISDKLKSADKKTDKKVKHIHRLNETLLLEYDLTEDDGSINREGIKAFRDLFEEYYTEKS